MVMTNSEVNAGPSALMEHPIDVRLEPGELGAILELILKDKDGKVTEYRRQKSKSFVANFMRLLEVYMQALDLPMTRAITDTGGVARNIIKNWNTYTAFRCDTAIGVITDGIVVGTGVGAPTINDTALGTIILHDAAPPTANRLQYSVMSFGAPAADATTSQFRLTRVLSNASGGLITVNEIGLYVKAWDVALKYILTIRDVIGGGIAVPNGQALTVNYQIQAVV